MGRTATTICRAPTYPAFIRKFHEAKASDAKEVVCWGTGIARIPLHRRPRAPVFFSWNYSEEQFINVGYGGDVSIRDSPNW